MARSNKRFEYLAIPPQAKHYESKCPKEAIRPALKTQGSRKPISNAVPAGCIFGLAGHFFIAILPAL